ncbi:LacI family DNA-binding transcriptional regulator [Vibrio sp. SCSIO 43137]|uniref:LacI family DNA-binding transcriptional regulator n=1 Tax=Vibrio sp. SCSIO 43137 TaxID=3021011 RepID=UPI0023071313|nr:LacI family DNA-binding transcriptional regulator [Vibrio sp. SCSIO 43137]WCE30790.1 LacI family DNA-binding transcriptional regulator [Vibrio sp. SCSIO 43137]
MKKPTSYDVAEKAGVSVTTVSLVLSEGKPNSISLATRKKVLNAVEELGYVKKPRRKNSAAKSALSHVRTPGIALIIDEICISDPFLEVFAALREVTDKHGYISEVYEVGDNPNRLDRIIGNINASDTTGVIFATHRTRDIDCEMLSNIQVPVVLLNCYTEGKTLYSTVLPGDSAGAYDATSHLINTGRKRIAHITGDMNDVAAQERVSGYRRALISHDIAVDHRLIVHGGWALNHGYDSTKVLLDLDEIPDAIVCGNDMSAVGAYLALTEAKVEIGSQIALIGYDNLPICQTLSPALTSMTIPYADMMRFALEELFTQLTDRKKNIRVTKVESEIVVRDSTGEV